MDRAAGRCDRVPDTVTNELDEGTGIILIKCTG